MTIHPVKINVLVEEIFVQGVFAKTSFESMNAILADDNKRQSRFVWVHLQGFLNHSAMISKMLDSPGKSSIAKARSSQLCATLQVDADSAVFDRNARNNVEHLDERLDNWLDHNSFNLLELVVDDRKGFEFVTLPRSLPNSTMFVRRLLILDEMVFVTQGRIGLEETRLSPLFDEICKIVDKAYAYISGDTSITNFNPGILPIR